MLRDIPDVHQHEQPAPQEPISLDSSDEEPKTIGQYVARGGAKKTRRQPAKASGKSSRKPSGKPLVVNFDEDESSDDESSGKDEAPARGNLKRKPAAAAPRKGTPPRKSKAQKAADEERAVQASKRKRQASREKAPAVGKPAVPPYRVEYTWNRDSHAMEEDAYDHGYKASEEDFTADEIKEWPQLFFVQYKGTRRQVSWEEFKESAPAVELNKVFPKDADEASDDEAAAPEAAAPEAAARRVARRVDSSSSSSSSDASVLSDLGSA